MTTVATTEPPKTETSLADVLAYFRPMPVQIEHREALGDRDKPHIIDWMQEHYILPAATGRLSGPWSLDMTPFWRPVLEWFCDQNTRVIWVIAATQTAKSTNLAGMLGYVIDVDPGPGKFVMPDKDIAKKRLKKIRASFKQSPRIMRHFASDIRNLFVGEPMEVNGMMMVMGWPTSPATLSDDACRYVWGDEVCEWKQSLKDDTNAIEKLANRVRTFEPISKQVFVTSPKNAGDLAHKGVKECQLWQIWIQCPHCQEYHLPDFKHVHLKKAPDGHLQAARLYKAAGQSWYACPVCSTVWSELERWSAVSRCRWAPKGCAINPAGKIEGEYDESPFKAIHLSALLVHPMFTTIATLATDYAKAQKGLKVGKIAGWRNFINNQMGQFWEIKDRLTSVEVLESHVTDSYKMWQVPGPVQKITIGIDVQADHVWVVTKGYGFQNQQWLIHAGRLETGHTGRQPNWDIVDGYICHPWVSQVDPSVVYYAEKINVDCRYQRAERDEESTVVYDFCLRPCYPEGVVNPVMGFGRKRMKLVPYGTSKPIAGSHLVRYNINVDLYKDRAWDTLHDPDIPPGPRYMHLPADLPENIRKQLCSEEQILVDGVPIWKVKDGYTHNHCWDANIYADVAAEFAGVLGLRDIDPVQACIQECETKRRKAEKRRDRRGGLQEGMPDII